MNLALLIAIVSLFFVLPSFAQTGRFELKDNFKPITLNQVIQQGLKENHDQKSREMQDTILNSNGRCVGYILIPTLTLSLIYGGPENRCFREEHGPHYHPTAPTGAPV